MSSSSKPLLPTAQPVHRRRKPQRIPSLDNAVKVSGRRASVSAGNPKAQRTSKTSQKLVVLPSEAQTKPDSHDQEDLTLGYDTDAGPIREYKSEAEKMTKEQRKRAGYKRLSAYCVAESLKMKLLTPFLKREHNVSPRIFDEALYVVYHLPLLPGYGPSSNIRSSAAPTRAEKSKTDMGHLSEAEDVGYQGTYFPSERSESHRDGYMTSSPEQKRTALPDFSPASPETTNFFVPPLSKLSSSSTIPTIYETDDAGTETETEVYVKRKAQEIVSVINKVDDEVAEVVFFEYGVVVFFGLTEAQEKGIVEDIEGAGILRRKIPEDDWEIEECHFTHDKNITNPRIYNDFFTLRSRSHLLKLSIAHALAQSTLLAQYETNAQRVLSSNDTLSIPTQLAQSGALRLRRHEALKLTGKLFKLRTDVNLVSNVLDVPELFWSEATLKELYDAVREYMEIGGRVQVLNEKLAIASDFLDAIHDHLNNIAMERITWIIIWLICVACLVEMGEVVARLVVHSPSKVASVVPIQQLSREEAIRTLERMIGQ